MLSSSNQFVALFGQSVGWIAAICLVLLLIGGALIAVKKLSEVR